MIRPSQLISLLENNSDILSFKISSQQYLIWPLVRFQLIIKMLNASNNLDNVNSTELISVKEKLRTILKSLSKNPFKIAAKKIIFFNSGITNIQQQGSDKYFNRVTDFFYLANPENSVLIEDHVNWSFRWPRIHNDVYSILPLTLKSTLLRKLSPRNLDAIDIQNIQALISSLKTKISFIAGDSFWDSVELDIRIICKQFINALPIYESFLKKRQPPVVFVEDGCYGASRSIIIKAAHNCGIPVAELQHGFINEEHHAYNYGQGIIADDELKTYFPDYYLTYGKFWSDMIQVPCEKIIIGNPYLIEKLKLMTESGTNRNILFFSSGITIEETNSLLIKLVALASEKQFTVTFRPHPGEWSMVEERYSKLFDLGVILDKDSDIYSSIRGASIAIGEVSTALFEAKAAGIPVFLFDSSYTKTYLTNSITFQKISPQNLETLFDDQTRQDVKAESEFYWNSNWKENYLDFLNSRIKV